MPICLRLLKHWMRAAASRTFCTAGTSRPIRMAMIAITTSNSMSVNARRERTITPGEERSIERPPTKNGVEREKNEKITAQPFGGHTARAGRRRVDAGYLPQSKFDFYPL